MAISPVSFTKTPQAKADDFNGLSESDFENADSSFLLDVMANDLGGKGKSLYSIDDGTGAPQDLLGKDGDDWELTAAGNEIQIKDGKVEYRFLGDVNTLSSRDIFQDSFIYAIEMGKGTLSYTRVTLTIQGQNDAASMSGDTTGSVTEDDEDGQTATGTLTVVDIDNGEAKAQDYSTTTDLGTFSVDENGVWTFAVNNEAIQYLGAGKTETLTFTVKSFDETAEQDVTITLVGVNDAADITGEDEGEVEEDGDLTASGTLYVDDVDEDESAFQAATAAELAGVYGTFAFDHLTGEWSYTLNNVQAQALDSSSDVTEVLTVRSIDGTTKQVTVTVKGADEPVVGTPNDTPPEQTPIDPATVHDINYGQNFINGYYIFKSSPGDSLDNDIFALKGQISFTGNMYTGDYLTDGVPDTYISISKEVGNETKYATIILVGVEQFDPDTQLL